MSQSVTEATSKNEKPTTIFRSYIGVKPYPKSLTEFPGQIINQKVDEFHFILGFAEETQDSNGHGTGEFRVQWEGFGKDKVVSLKKQHPKSGVKVIISIGGNKHAFNPRDKDEWIGNAVSSIKAILEEYKLDDAKHTYTIDGIDINYQFVNPRQQVEVFSESIGSVIKQLHDADMNVNVVSIAPSASVKPHYKKLYSDYPNYIKWVGYQFYHEKVQGSPNDFVKLYKSIVNEYAPHVVLAGGSTDPDNRDNIPQQIFLAGCKELIKELPGIFIWNANDSAPNYDLEVKAQELLSSKPQH